MDPDPPVDPSVLSTSLNSSFLLLPGDSASSSEDLFFKFYVTVLECQTSKPDYACISLNKSMPKATRVIPESQNPNWSQTFVFTLSDTMPFNQQTLNIQLFDMNLETSISSRVGMQVLALESLLKHHNDVEWFEFFEPGARILVGFCFDEYDMLQEILRHNLPIRRSPDALHVYPLIEPALPQQGPSEASVGVEEQQLQSSIIDELRKSTERDLGSENANAIVQQVEEAAKPPPLPPRTNIPPPLPDRIRPAAPMAPTRYRPQINFDAFTDLWFKQHARDTDPDNITVHFDDVYDDFRNSRDHASIIKNLIGDEASQLICLFVPGLYAGRMPFKVRQDMNVVWAKRMGELQAMGLDARVIQVPIDGPVLLNATIIGSLMQDLRVQFPEKRFVLVGYSKGGVDFSAALALMPDLQEHVRCFITMFSPLYGSHIATDLNGTGFSTITGLAVQKVMGLDPEAMRDLTIPARKLFLNRYPIPTKVPMINLTGSMMETPSNLRFLYQYIKSRYNKESDGVVACCDAVVPGCKKIVLFNTDHKGAHEGNKRYNDQVNLLASLICCGVEVTRHLFSAPPPLPPRNIPPSPAPIATEESSSLYPSLEGL